MGDQSDNIPGIPGVGEKTALKLVQEFGSVANLIANTDKISSKSLKEKIEENAQLALMSRRLATINTEVPIEIDFDEFKAEEPDYNALIELYSKLEFNSFLKKLQLQESGNTSAGTAQGTASESSLASRRSRTVFAGIRIH
jgi:DNA polymerase-1